MSKIPKKIHYCWFGGNPLPDDVKRYIETWKKHCPDYEIKEWNESNFDINCNKYVKQAYEAKKYAFVSDYARVSALYNEGGIYMDTDVEVLKPLDEFLEHNAFTGFESNDFIMTALMGTEKNGEWIKSIIDIYDGLSFIKEDGTLDLTTNVARITEMMSKKYNFDKESSYQDLGDVTLYPYEYFSPKDWDTGEIDVTENTHTIHHFSGTWHSKKDRKYLELKAKFIKKYGLEKGKEKYFKRINRIDRIKNLIKKPIKKILSIFVKKWR